MNRREKNVFLIESFLLTLSFLLVIMIISAFFERSVQISKKARQLNDAVLLSENAVEILRAFDDQDEAVAFLRENFACKEEDGKIQLLFDKNMQASLEAEYLLEIRVIWQDEMEDIHVETKDALSLETIYELDLNQYRGTGK